jgi:hypothetical protein
LRASFDGLNEVAALEDVPDDPLPLFDEEELFFDWVKLQATRASDSAKSRAFFLLNPSFIFSLHKAGWILGAEYGREHRHLLPRHRSRRRAVFAFVSAGIRAPAL